MSRDIDTKLFPIPSHLLDASRDKTPLIPRTWPGFSPSSTNTLQGILSDNHRRWHIFFNDKGFHNHSAHAMLTLWSLGADSTILESSYRLSSQYQRPLFASPGHITHENWRDHMGDEKYYEAYIQFFEEEASTKSFDALLEEYIFAPSANFIGGIQNQPEMLNRFFDGLIHPLIHTGLGIEFGMPGIVVEGLAQTAIHAAQSTAVIPASLFDDLTDGLASRFSSGIGITEKGAKTDVHAFTILARILEDPNCKEAKEPPSFELYRDVMKNHGDAIFKYVAQWTLDGDLMKKVEELLWTNVIIYAVGGAEQSGQFNADFFHMHLVTSSLFLPTIFSQLKRISQVLLLRGYFAVCLAWYIGRGRPALDIEKFFSDPSTLLPVVPGPQPTPHKDVNPSPSSPHAITPNPWLAILQSTLTHPDDHLPKLQRALAEYGSQFGHIPAGYFEGTELKGAGNIDGTLFLRAASLCYQAGMG